jgi:hypothetical protein
MLFLQELNLDELAREYKANTPRPIAWKYTIADMINDMHKNDWTREVEQIFDAVLGNANEFTTDRIPELDMVTTTAIVEP